MSASKLLLSLFEYKAWANEELLAALGRVDAAAHADTVQAATRLLNHISVVDRIFAAHLRGREHGFDATNTDATPSLAELTETVRATDRGYVDFLKSATAQALTEVIAFTFTDGLRGRMTREEMLAHVLTHGNYHRGSVGRMLSEIGIKPPRDSVTVFLHATQPERRAPG